MNTKIVLAVTLSMIAGGAALAQQAGGGPAPQSLPPSGTMAPRSNPGTEQTTGGAGMTNPERSQTTGQANQGGKMQPQMPVPKQNERPEQPGK